MFTADRYAALRAALPLLHERVADDDPDANAEANRSMEVIAEALRIAERVMTPGFMTSAFAAHAMRKSNLSLERMVRAALMKEAADA